MVTELLNKYIWLVQTLLRTGREGLTFQEISARWERRFNNPYARRTFNNHREAIWEVFEIEIQCNRSTNTYYIELDNNNGKMEEISWLIDTFTANNMLTLGKNKLPGRVSVEEVPSGRLHLTTIMDAMQDNLCLKIEYKKYLSDHAEILTLHPYAVKEASRRWYVVAYCVEREGIRVYSIDRITSIQVLDTYFEMPSNFDVDTLFATSFGIFLNEGKAENIIFKTSIKDAKYLIDLPLHRSQTLLEQNEDSYTFSIFAIPNQSMMIEFKKFGSGLEVLSPESIREEIRKDLIKNIKLYNDEN